VIFAIPIRGDKTKPQRLLTAWGIALLYKHSLKGSYDGRLPHLFIIQGIHHEKDHYSTPLYGMFCVYHLMRGTQISRAKFDRNANDSINDYLVNHNSSATNSIKNEL
jgi:hypothetical protein